MTALYQLLDAFTVLKSVINREINAESRTTN